MSHCKKYKEDIYIFKDLNHENQVAIHFIYLPTYLIVSSSFIFLHLSAMNSLGMGSSSSVSFPLVLTKCVSPGGARLAL